MKIPVSITRIEPCSIFNENGYQSGGLKIIWPDSITSHSDINKSETHKKISTEYYLSARLLRANCPSASEKVARNELDHDRPLNNSPKSNLNTPNQGKSNSFKKNSSLQIVTHSIEEAHRIVEIRPIGNYAIGIKYGDGHQSGIYSFDLLWALCELASHSEKLQAKSA
jgi:DUF971 family protein